MSEFVLFFSVALSNNSRTFPRALFHKKSRCPAEKRFPEVKSIMYLTDDSNLPFCFYPNSMFLAKMLKVKFILNCLIIF